MKSKFPYLAGQKRTAEQRSAFRRLWLNQIVQLGASDIFFVQPSRLDVAIKMAECAALFRPTFYFLCEKGRTDVDPPPSRGMTDDVRVV